MALTRPYSGGGSAQYKKVPGGPNIGLSEDEDAIVAPQRTTLQQSLDALKSGGGIPQFKPVDFNPVGSVKGTLDDDYFNTIEQQATQKLNDKFFGAPDSVQKNLTNTMNKRGLIGSGIEVGGMNQLYKTYGDELVDLQGTLAKQKAETTQDVAFKNKEIEMRNAEQALAAQQKNREFEGFLSELGLRSAADESRTATDFDTKMFEQQVDLRDTERDFTSDMLDRLNTALQNGKIDPETRQIFEDIFGSNIGNYMGTPESNTDWSNLRRKQSEVPNDEQWHEPGRGYTRDGVNFRNSPYPGVPMK